MKSLTIIAILLGTIIAAGFISHTTIEFHPFHISCRYWYRGVGFILFLIGMTMMQAGDYRIGYEKGFKNGADEIIKLIEEKVKKNEND